MLLVAMLALEKQGATFLHCNEALDAERLTSLGNGSSPLGNVLVVLLADGRLLGADDLAALGLHERSLLQAFDAIRFD